MLSTSSSRGSSTFFGVTDWFRLELGLLRSWSKLSSSWNVDEESDIDFSVVGTNSSFC